MKRILFVDDEPRLLEGLQRMLRPQRREWDMLFASGGEEALAVMAQAAVDVVVTDMRMPGMDGATLLQRVHEQFPGVMRIVLSGQFEVEAGLRAVPVAHQFLTKPCDPDKLKAAIERSSQLGDASVPDEATRRIVSAVGALPSPPRICASLMEAIQNPGVSMEEIGRIVNQDVAITAKVLQLVNSAFFSIPHKVSDVKTAVSLLGFEVLKQLVVSAEVLKTFRPARPIRGFSLDEFERHAQASANIAGELAPRNLHGESVMAAMLHDAGKLVLATRLPDQFERALDESSRQGRPLDQSEREVFGTTHAEIGGYILNLWGLPSEGVDAISVHHQPDRVGDPKGQLSLRALIHVADVLAHEQTVPLEELPPIPFGIDMNYLSRMEMVDRIPEWRMKARQITAREPK